MTDSNTANLAKNDWAAAVLDVPTMLLKDRYALIDKLPRIIEKSPQFGLALTAKLATDKNEKIATGIAYKPLSILNSKPDVAFDMARAITIPVKGSRYSKAPETLSKYITSFFRKDVKKSTKLAHDILTKNDSGLSDIFADKLNDIATIAHQHNPTQTNPVFKLAKSVITQDKKTAKKILEHLPTLAAIDAKRSMELVEYILHSETGKPTLIETLKEIANQLPIIASLDKERAFELMGELSDYRNIPNHHKGDHAEVKSWYTYVTSNTIDQIGALAQYDEDRAFAFAEQLVNGTEHWKTANLMNTQIWSLSKVNTPRAIDLCKKYIDTDPDGRAAINALSALSRQSRSKRITVMIDQVISTNDQTTIKALAEALADKKLSGSPKAKKEEWAQIAYQTMSQLDNHYSDEEQIITGLAKLSDKAPNAARSKMVGALGKMGLTL
ncbi:MAG: hypothetical protein COB76_01190 [Alphaproteobacteria bacterium]|nr:MAG: hypothetical protein COB76_01190 [Alphaproteobacteria bacterium]